MWRIIVAAAACLLLCWQAALAAEVSLQWDANESPPEGYRAFYRTEGQPYDYSAPAWNGTETTCTISDLAEGQTYYFVVRAYEGDTESGDSNEVSWQAAIIPAGIQPTQGFRYVNIVRIVKADEPQQPVKTQRYIPVWNNGQWTFIIEETLEQGDTLKSKY
jgi:hypothetical protein